MAEGRLRRLGARAAPLATSTPAAPTAHGDAASSASPRDVAIVSAMTSPALAESHSRERIAGSPLVPDGVRWANDGRVAVVSEASILISTFLSRELEMYIQHSPVISKSFIFVPDAEQLQHERVPLKVPVFSEPTDAPLPPGSLTYFLLHENDRHQYNPKEVSLSKNDGTAFLAATWGPRGSGPNASCAVLALTSSSRISLHFSSSFHLSWKQAAVFSENLFDFLASRQWTLQSSNSSSGSSLTPAKSVKTECDSQFFTTPINKTKDSRQNGSSATPASGSAKKRRRLGSAPTSSTTATDGATTMSMAEYARRCALVSTLSIAWSPFLTNAEQHTTSLIALCGRAITTVWCYDAPTCEAFAAVDGPTTSTGDKVSLSKPSATTTSTFLSPTPSVWLDTEKHGWVTTSTWQQLHRLPHHTLVALQLAMGTSDGKVLLATIPVGPRETHVAQVAIDRVLLAPHLQPVFGLRLGSRHTFSNSDRNDLVVASGSRISVWNLRTTKKRPQPVTWKAHEGNVTGLDVDYFGEKIFSCGVDGQLRLWDAVTGTEIPYVAHTTTTTSEPPAAPRYPMFGLAVSPNSAQVACLYVIPPAARPNRKSQADVSYSRVSTALEYVPTPYASQSSVFVQTMCNILEQGRDMSTMADVLWFCHDDNAAITSLHGTADLTLPHLLNKLKGVGGGRNGEDARQPLYLSLCSELEKRYYAKEGPGHPAATAAMPLFLQGAFLLRSCIPPAEHHVAVRDAALGIIKRSLYVYWAERCLKELLASHSQVQNLADISKTERIAALLMADFLSVQEPMSASVERIVTTIYNRIGSEDNIARWSAYLQARVDFAASKKRLLSLGDETSLVPPVPPVPPPRQTCLICDEAVPFGELEQFCLSGHVQDRCFLSFQVLSSMDTWKCMGCGAAACEIDFSLGRAPFYVLEGHDALHAPTMASASTMQLVCRLCGNYCSFLRY